MSTDTDADTATIRRELREAGVEGVPDKGRLSADHMDAWRSLRATEPDDGFGPNDPPGDPGESDRPVPPQDRPRQPRGRSARGSLPFFPRSRAAGGKRKPAGRKTRGPRLSVATLIEDSWYQFANIFEGVPPLQRCLTMQAPYAGIMMEGAVKNTIIDVALQPIARNADRGSVIGGLVGLPLSTALAVQNAPAPGEEPSARFKGAVFSMRMSARLLARAGVGKAEELAAHAEQVQARAHEADRLVAWILTGELPPEDEPTLEGEESAMEDEAIARARALFN